MNKNILNQTPSCVTRLGEQLFLRIPLFELTKKPQPIYINKELFKHLFNLNIDLEWEEMAVQISSFFNFTLDKTNSTGKQVGWGYVDKQADPLNLSLAGNQGSGRAYYVGSCFNIKGEKTPLATSTDPNHSNGILSLSAGLWNTLIANSVFDEIETGLSPILAIFNTSDGSSLQAKIIRVDQDGSLDRMSHLFYKKHKLSPENFATITAAFAQQEAEKFIHRILHGSWSSGNISPQGHLIDYDSICIVKGRHPQYSATLYFPDNYFGLEHLGQLKILNALTNDAEINFTPVAFSAIENDFKDQLELNIARKLPYLLGFDHHQELFQLYEKDFTDLSKLFCELSRYVRFKDEFYYHVSKNYFVGSPLSLVTHLFDFSAFFRIFPMLKNHHCFSLDRSLQILLGDPVLFNERELSLLGNFNPEPLPELVQQHLKPYFFQQDLFIDLKNQAIHFLTQLNFLYDSILNNMLINSGLIERRAYIINEDRLYLFPVFSLITFIEGQCHKGSPKYINELISLLIRACKRNPDSIQAISDHRLFEEGWSYISFDMAGHFQVIFYVLKDHLVRFGDYSDLHIVVNEKLFPAQLEEAGSYFKIVSHRIPNCILLFNYSRYQSFNTKAYQLYVNGTLVSMTDFYLSDNEKLYYLT